MKTIDEIKCPYCGHEDIDLGRADDLCRETEQRTGYCPACARNLCISYVRSYTNSNFLTHKDIVIESMTIFKIYPFYRIENIVKCFSPNNRIKTYKDYYVVQSIEVDE